MGSTGPGPAALHRQMVVERCRRADRLQRAGRAELAVQAVHDRAEALVDVPPWTVTAPKLLPAGGSPHEYVHVAEYAWPDPEDPALPWVLRDGQVNPEAHALASDGRRLAQLADAVRTLAWADVLVDDRRFGSAVQRLLRSWFVEPATAMHPSLRFAVCVPGRAEPMDWGLARLLPLLDLLDAAVLVSTTADADPVDPDLLGWCEQMLGWLLASRLFDAELARGNNHATRAVGLALGLAVVTDDVVAAELASAAGAVVRAQVAADGAQPAELERSRSYFYCGYNLGAMLRVAELCWCCGVDLFGPTDAPRRALDALLPFLVDPRRWPSRSVEPTDERRHGDLLVHAVATWPGNERIADALGRSTLRPGSSSMTWIEHGVAPDVVIDRGGRR